MNTQQINTLVKSDYLAKQIFIGTYPSDNLPKPLKYPFCIIANIDSSNKGGSHWVSLYISKNAQGEFFDSYGQQPSKPFEIYLNKHCKNWKSNTQRIQGILASTCGHYCILMVLMWSRGYNIKEVINRFDSKDCTSNDVVVTAFINQTFDCSFPTYDQDYLAQQISVALPQLNLGI